MIWEGYANQREDLFDKFNYTKECLKSYGHQPVRDGYPYVTITDKMVACPVLPCLGCTEGTNVYVYYESPDWVYIHEFIHFIMKWNDEGQAAFTACIEVQSPSSCPTSRAEK